MGNGSYNGIVTANNNAIIFSGGTLGTGNLVIAPWASATSGIKIVGSTGNVGIGTNAPSIPLTVASGATQFPTAIYVQPSTNATSRRAAIGLDDWFWMQDINGNGTKDFMLFQASAAAGRIIVGINGNVGIGVGATGNNQARLSISRTNTGPCCGGEDATLAISDALGSGRRASISFHTGGESEGEIELTQAATGIGVKTGSDRRLRFFDHQGSNLGLQITGPLWYGNGDSRTETRQNAGLKGDAGAQSGFYEAEFPVNFYSGASSWQHLIDVRHSNATANNYAMQIAGSFFDQTVWFRKTNDNAAAPWQSIPGVMASGNITFGDPGSTAPLVVVGAFNITSVSYINQNSTDSRYQVNFTTALPDANYLVGFTAVGTDPTWNADNDCIWTVVGATTTGFQIAFREVSGGVQNFTLRFRIMQ